MNNELQTQKQKQAEIVTTAQEQNRISEHYMQVDTRESQEIQQELMQGPPAELGKFARKQWVREKQELLQRQQTVEAARLRENEQFCAPAWEMLDSMAAKLDSYIHDHKETPEAIERAFIDCAGARFSVQGLVHDEKQLPEQMQGLGEILDALSRTTPQDFTQEEAAALVKRYHKLGQEVGAVSVIQLDDTAAMDPASCYVLLYNCASVMLEDAVDKLPAEQVDLKKFSKLRALAALSGLAAGTLCMNEGYLKTKSENKKKLERQAAEQEQTHQEEKLTRESRIKYLETGIGTDGGAPKTWLLGPYAKLAAEAFGEEITKDDWKTFANKAFAYEKMLGINLPALERLAESSGELTMGIPALKNAALEKLKQSLGTRLLTKNLEEMPELNQLFQQAVAENGELLALYRQRRERLTAMDGIAKLSHALDLPEIQFIISADDGEELFARRAESLNRQANENIAQAREMLSAGLSSVSRSEAEAELIKSEGKVLLVGSPAGVSIATEQFLRHLSVLAPLVDAKEKSFRKAMRLAGIGADWLALAEKRAAGIDVEDEKQLDDAMAELKKLMDTNLAAFDEAIAEQKLSSADWQTIEQWKNEKLDSAPEQFARELSDQLGQLKKDATGAVSKSEYLYGAQAEKLKAQRPKPGVAEKALRGAALCQWEGIADAYAGAADEIMAALAELLSNKKLPYPEVTGIESLAQLDTLQRQQLAALSGKLRSNLGVVAQAWKDLHCTNEQEIKKRLLPEILCGRLTQEGFDARAQEEAQNLLKEEEALGLRFSLALGGTGGEKGMVQYRYLDAKKGGAVLTETSRADRRIERLKQAEQVWDELRALKLEKDARELCRDAEKGKHLHSKLLDLVKGTKGGKDFAAKLSKMKPEDYAAELRIAGFEDVAMGQQKLANAFTEQDHDNYKRTIRESGKIMRAREIRLITLLEENKVPLEEQTRILSSLRELVGGMEPFLGKVTQEEKERNLNRFGVESWEKAIIKIGEELTPEKLEKAKAEAQALSPRISYLHSLRGGLLQPMEKSLLQDPELWKCLSGGTELAYKELLEQTADKLEAPLRALRLVGGSEGFLQQQILMECGERFLTETHGAREWYEICRNTYEQIAAHKIGDTSIADRFEAIIDKKDGIFGTMRPYLTVIVLADGMSFLGNTKDTKAVLQRYEKNVIHNEAALNTFLARAAESEATKTGFRQYLLTKIVFSTPVDFESGLGGWLTQFKELETETKRNVRLAHKEMDRRTAVMCDVEQHKEEGRQAEASDAAILEKLRSAPSPLLSTLGRQVMPDAKAIGKAREAVEKALRDYPQLVKDCLFERVLFGDSVDQMKSIAETLSELYDQISSMKFSDKTLNESGRDAFFTYVFAKEGANKLSPAKIKARFDEFAEKRKLLSEIGNINTDDPVLQTECRLLEDAMGTAMFTMEKEQYTALLTRRLNYLRAEALAGPIMEKLLAKETPIHKAKLKMGLRDYFHAQLLKGSGSFNSIDFQAAVKQLLEDKTVKQYLEDSTTLLGGVAWDDLQSTEVTSMTLLNRRGLESFLQESADEKQLAAYNALDVAQRQIFALALTAPGGAGAGSLLPSRQVLQNETAQQSALIDMQTQLQAYIKQEKFAPQVNYTLALAQLKAGGKLDENAFSQALTFTNLCISRRQEGIPTDFSRLADGRESLEAVRRIARQKGERTAPSDVIPEPKSMEEFFSQLLETDKEQASTVKKQLAELKDTEKQLLVRALQDRTNLDYTTRVTMLDRGKGTVQDHVNEPQRQAFLNWYADSDTKETSAPVNGEAIKQAMVSLFSYQIRDDADISCRSLREEDIVDFDRGTSVDWELLDRAIKFVTELEQSRLRLQGVKQATALIEKSENEPAIELYHQHKAKVETEEEFSSFLKEQAEKDGQLALLGGFLALEEREKSLFLKALGSRDVLDVSKEGIMANRFGIGERDYVNPRARYALIDNYLRNSRGKEGLPVEKGDCHKALLSLLSTQVADDAGFTGDEELDKKLTSAALFKSPRKTAVDWKLMQRALQLVSRTGNERSIFLEDRELYAAYGDMSKGGGFSFEGDYLRQNLHSAGNRFSRFFGRRVVSHIDDAIPGPLKTMVRALLPMEAANKVNEMFPVEEDEQSILEKGNDFLESVSDFYKDKGKEKVKRFISKKTADALGEKLETASEHLGYVTSGVSLAGNVMAYGKLAHAKKEAEKAQEEPVAATLTEAEQKLVDAAKERNEHLQNQGAKKASQRQTDEVIKTVTEIAGGLIGDAVGDETDIISAAVEEAGELVNFLRSWFNDKKSVKDYFSRGGDAARIRASLGEKGLSLPGKMDDIELLRQAKGFENYTEMASFVGLNIARSLMFCASRYNPIKSTRILAVSTLTVLGQEECIGKQDSAAAQKVYDAMMGGSYR